VWTHFVEVEQPALQALAPEGFPFFTSGERTVHTDGHVEVGGATHVVLAGRSISSNALAAVRIDSEEVLTGLFGWFQWLASSTARPAFSSRTCWAG
jgi:hypothetical protein